MFWPRSVRWILALLVTLGLTVGSPDAEAAGYQVSPGEPAYLLVAGVKIPVPKVKGGFWEVTGKWWRPGNAYVGYDELARTVRGKVKDRLRVRIDKMAGGDCAVEIKRHLGDAKQGHLTLAAESFVAGIGRGASSKPLGPKWAELHVCRADGPWLLKAVLLFKKGGKLKVRGAKRALKPYKAIVGELWAALKGRATVLSRLGKGGGLAPNVYTAASAPWISAPRVRRVPVELVPGGTIVPGTAYGGVWSAQPRSGVLRRRLPTLAAVDLHVRAENKHTKCPVAIQAWAAADANMSEASGVRNIPPGWTAALWKGMLDPALVMCAEVASGVLRVTIASETRATDLAGLRGPFMMLGRMSAGTWYVPGTKATATRTGAQQLRTQGGRVTLPVTGLVVDLPTSRGTKFWSVHGVVTVEPRSGEAPEIYLNDYLGRYSRTGVRRASMRIGADYWSLSCAKLIARDGDKVTDIVEGTTTFQGAVGSWKYVAFLTKARKAKGNKQVTVELCRPHPKRKGVKLLWMVEWIHSRTLTAGAVVAELHRHADLAVALDAAFVNNRYAFGKGTKARHVARTKAWKTPTLVLPETGLRVQPPDDGTFWTVASKSEAKGKDRLFLQLPTFSTASLAVGVSTSKGTTSCQALVKAAKSAGRQVRAKGPKNLPTGWFGYQYKDGARWVWTACLKHSSGAFVSVWDDYPGLEFSDFGPFASMLRALGKAKLGSKTVAAKSTASPAPSGGSTGNRPSTSKRATPTRSSSSSSSSSSGGSRGLFFVGTEVVVSHRDSAALGVDVDNCPSTRFSYLGLDVTVGFGEFNPGLSYFLRMSGQFSVDLGNAFSDGVSNASRWGGTHIQFDAEGYIGLSNGDFFFGVGGGWQGILGPITDNSSLSVSAIVAWITDDEDAAAFWLRVTPVQLVPANERMLMSPLTVDLRIATGGGIFVGFEAQYIAGPGDGITDTPGEAFAGLFRIGMGVGGD